MDKNKVTFKENDGLYLDGIKLEALKSYSLEGRATKGGGSQATLKVEMMVDDLGMFKQNLCDYEEKKMGMESKESNVEIQALKAEINSLRGQIHYLENTLDVQHQTNLKLVDAINGKGKVEKGEVGNRLDNFVYFTENEKPSISKINPINIDTNKITGGYIAQVVKDSMVEIIKDGIKMTAKNINLDGDVKNTNQEKTDDSKVYEENGKVGTKVDPMLLDIFRAIDGLSSRLDALDSKINLKADSKELYELIKDIH